MVLLSLAGERKGRKERLAELLDFADEHLINDRDLAQQHAPCRSTEGLHSRQYWVTLFLHKSIKVYVKHCYLHTTIAMHLIRGPCAKLEVQKQVSIIG